MRFLVAALVIWLFLFYNVERLGEPVNLTDVAYVFVPIVVITMTVTPRLHKAPLWVLFGVPILIFLLLKVWLGLQVSGVGLSLTTTEVCAIAVTIFLVRLVSNGLSEFERVVARITIGRVGKFPDSFSDAQAAMYRELNRARHHKQPLALLAVRIDGQSIQVALDRMVQEVQQAMMTQYVLSGVARVLNDELEDYNIIAQRNNDDFLVLMPEVSVTRLDDFIDRLRETAFEQMGVVLEVGTAFFPDDAVTFDGLVDRAVGRMKDEEMDGIYSY